MDAAVLCKKGNGQSEQLTGNRSEASSIQQGSRNEVRLHSGKLKNPHGNEWNHPCRKIPKIALQAKVSLHGPMKNLVHKFIPVPQAMQILDAKAAVDKECTKARDNSSMATVRSRVRRRLFSKHKETKRKSTLLHWWTHVTQKMQCQNQKCKNTKAESYSEVTLWKMIQDRLRYLLSKDHQHHKWRPQK